MLHHLYSDMVLGRVTTSDPDRDQTVAFADMDSWRHNELIVICVQSTLYVGWSLELREIFSEVRG